MLGEVHGRAEGEVLEVCKTDELVGHLGLHVGLCFLAELGWWSELIAKAFFSVHYQSNYKAENYDRDQ